MELIRIARAGRKAMDLQGLVLVVAGLVLDVAEAEDVVEPLVADGVEKVRVEVVVAQ